MINSLCLFTLLGLSASVYLEQKLDSVMTMGWDIDETSSTIDITLKCQITLGYCSVGLRKTMTNCDMFAALIDSDSQVTVQDYWSRDHSTPRTDAREGGQNDYTVVTTGSGSDASGHVLVTFRRKLNTGDTWDQQIYTDIRSQICWAYRDNRNGWREHSDYATFAWATTKSKMFFQKSSSEIEEHGQYMSIAWGLFATVGISTARYFKHRWWWFYVHFILLNLASLATIVTSSVMYKEDQYPYSTVSDDTFLHSRVGMILSSLVIAQLIFGLGTSYFKIYTRNSHATLLFNRSHKLVGYALFIAGLYNCWVGWDLYGSRGKGLIIIAFVLAILLFGVMEVWQICWRNKITKPHKSLPIYTHLQAIDMIKSGKKLMFANELVIDIGHFAISHPGGQYMLAESIGEDTGKYMVGCSSYDGNLNPYVHSEKAFSMLKGLAIGQIASPAGYLSLIPDSNPEDSVFMNFKFIKQQKLNDHTQIAYFSSDFYKMGNQCQSPEWLGKHFMIAYKKNMQNVMRYYSSIFVDLNQWSNELGLPSESSTDTDGTVKFIYKVYPDGKMSNYIHNLKDKAEVMLRGPLGPGLLMNSLEGKYLALGGGTGLVPFLDLVHMAWKKYGNSTDKFTLNLFAFFRNTKDGFGLEILQKMADECSWLKLRIVTEQDPRKKEAPDEVKKIASEGIDMAWICGPSGFNRVYSNSIAGQGVDKAKIILL